MSHAVNLYRAALSGPLRDNTRADVLTMLTDCLAQLAQQPTLDAPLSAMPGVITVV